jgi:ribosome-associated protein
MAESKEIPDPGPTPASKSQRRRDALEVKALAARLLVLSPSLLSQLPLDDELKRAVEQARAIRSHVARKRQLQFVAKLLRRGETEPIIEAIAAFDADARQLTARQHRTEAWRDRLVGEGDPALSELLVQRPDSERQRLRQLIRKARQEAAAGKPPAAARSLFRALRDLDEIEPLPPVRSG